MATNESLKNQLAAKPQKQVAPGQLGLKALMNTPTMRKKFEEVLHDNANAFMSNVMTLVSNDSYLADSEPMSIMSGALTAATLNLGLDKNLGYAYLVPFNSKNKQTGKWEKKAQFLLGYKGYIQLAQRSGKYKALNVIEVYEGELKSWNRLTEEFDFDPNGRKSDEVIGYVGYFELLNGFKKTVYWTKQEIEAHRIANSNFIDDLLSKLGANTGKQMDDQFAIETKTIQEKAISTKKKIDDSLGKTTKVKLTADNADIKEKSGEAKEQIAKIPDKKSITYTADTTQAKTETRELGETAEKTESKFISLKDKLSIGAVAGATSQAVQVVTGSFTDLIGEGIAASDDVSFDIDTYALKTQIKGYGKLKENANTDNLKDSDYVFPPVTYTSAESEKWGIRIQDPVEDERYTIQNNMLVYLKQQLHDYPDISGSVTLKWAVSLDKGDKVLFVYEPLSLSTYIQVVGITTYPAIPNKAPEIILSNTKKTITSILANLARKGLM